MLAQAIWNGDGESCECALQCTPQCPRRLTFATVEADRITPGGPYARWNVQPACRHCNLARSDNPIGRLVAA